MKKMLALPFHLYGVVELILHKFLRGLISEYLHFDGYLRPGVHVISPEQVLARSQIDVILFQELILAINDIVKSLKVSLESFIHFKIINTLNRDVLSFYNKAMI